jgi:hypothetical protein
MQNMHSRLPQGCPAVETVTWLRPSPCAGSARVQVHDYGWRGTAPTSLTCRPCSDLFNQNEEAFIARRAMTSDHR